MKGKTMFKKFFYLCSVTCVLLLFPVVSHAAPVLYFSDLTSGPKTGLGDGLGSGAVVTIWGVNIGSTQGTSKVYVGDVEAAYVYEWTNATQHKGHPADLYTYHKMQTIAFSVPAAAIDGANTIKVVVNGVTSNTLPFTVRTGKIYFVKVSGTDTGNGSGSNGDWNNPWRNINYYSRTLSGVTPGSILYVTDGVTVTSQYGILFSGTSGTSDNPYAIAAYPGASVSSTDLSGAAGPEYPWGTRQYWHLSKIKLEAPSNAYTFSPKGRVIGLEITDHPTSPCSGIMSGLVAGAGGASDPNAATPDGVTFLGNYIHDYCSQSPTQSSQQHTTYFSNRTGVVKAPFEIGWNYLYNNMADHGIHIYDEGVCGGWSGTVKIHDNVVVSQRGISIGVNPSCAPGYGPVTTVFEIFNNLVIDGGRGPYFLSNGGLWSVGMAFGTGTIGTSQSAAQYTMKVYNNTIYGVGETVRDIGSNYSAGFLHINPWFGSLDLKNNVFVDTKNWPWITNGATNPTTSTNNLWYNGGDGNPANPPSWDTAPITSNPLFVSTAGSDFHLQSGSPAIDAGANIGSPVLTDFDGNTRPMGTGYDIGAYEYAGPAVPMLQFSSATYSVSEAGPTATITVTRTGSAAGAVSVNYATSNGTATAGSDYTTASGTLSWIDGETTSKTFTVAITNDTLVEPDETINLTLTSPTGGAILGSQSTAVLTILDNDGPPILRFENSSYSVSEGAGTATIRVLRTGSAAGAVSVNYATSNGTATAGSDYTAASGTLSWIDGETTSKTFTITIINDTVVESNETINLTLSNPTNGAILGSQSTAVLTILDNDGGGGNTPPPSSGGDSSASGGSGCGYIKDDDGKGPRAKGEALTFAIMLMLTLFGVAIRRRIQIKRKMILG